MRVARLSVKASPKKPSMLAKTEFSGRVPQQGHGLPDLNLMKPPSNGEKRDGKSILVAFSVYFTFVDGVGVLDVHQRAKDRIKQCGPEFCG
ncbi:MAG: hypothetical protein ACOVN5_05985 [Aquidulcibacter sp.]